MNDTWQKKRCPECGRFCYLIGTPVGVNLILVDCEDHCRAREKYVKVGWIMIDRATILPWGLQWRTQENLLDGVSENEKEEWQG